MIDNGGDSEDPMFPTEKRVTSQYLTCTTQFKILDLLLKPYYSKENAKKIERLLPHILWRL